MTKQRINNFVFFVIESFFCKYFIIVRFWCIFGERKLTENSVVRNFRTTTKHGAIAGKTQSYEVEKQFIASIEQANKK